MDVTFYLTNKGESGWKDLVFVNDKYLILLEEIKTILDTPAGTVMGCEGMDGDMERFVFMKYVNPKDIDKKVNEQISMFSAMASEFTVNVSSQIANAGDSKICVVDITIAHMSTPNIPETMRAVFS